jgi:hypothetical protein
MMVPWRTLSRNTEVELHSVAPDRKIVSRAVRRPTQRCFFATQRRTTAVRNLNGFWAWMTSANSCVRFA